MRKIDCESREAYMRAVEASAERAEKEGQDKWAYISRMRGLSNTEDPDEECEKKGLWRLF